ncbi:MAG TPA: amidohydrolase family protein [Acidimicrobiales bacterium]|jgi:predicted TIM-barrel fold metal-dependent hydrolase|nr:amidohydrolase family protein [Acidimicrobiales bacterium]
MSEPADLPLVDSDSHVTEPADLWTSRVSRKWGDDVPHLEWDQATGQRKWQVGRYRLFGEAIYAMAGWPDFPPSHPKSLDEADRGAWDATARLQRLDEYGIYAQVLYPNLVAFSTHAFTALDPNLAIDCVRAYNDFIAEFAAADPARLIPIMMLPFWDGDASAAELERATALGHRGVLLAADPTRAGLPPLWDDYWAPVLAMAEERALPINFHIGFNQDPEELAAKAGADGPHHTRINSVGMLSNARAVSDMICTGVCARFPDLKIVSVESGAGWLPYLLESLDWHWKSYGGFRDRPDMELPSFYLRRQIYGTFWFEEEAFRRCAEVLPDNLMFETDFPHPTSLSPGPASPADRPREMAERATAGLPDALVRKVFYETAASLYRIPIPVGAA